MNKVRKLLALLTVPEYRAALFSHKVAAAVEHESDLGRFRFSTVVDVGGNRGQFSLFAARTFEPQSIVAFEPLAGPAARMARLFADDERLTLHRMALGATVGEAVMHVSAHDDSSSMLPISGLQSATFPGTEEVRTEDVCVTTLDSVLSAAEITRPALLKIDVQGFELEVLRGCESLLGSFDRICVEGSFVELYVGQVLAPSVISWLTARGFVLDRLYGAILDKEGRVIQADMLFSRGAEGGGR